LPTAAASSITVMPDAWKFGRSGTTITSAHAYSSCCFASPDAEPIFTFGACHSRGTRRRVASRTS
jgi:hypothetical protein